ncbi:MAG: hypothetical protein ACI9P9_000801 [Patescibacteria group bacterium]|jgi:hypothetical protein
MDPQSELMTLTDNASQYGRRKCPRKRDSRYTTE